MTGTGSAVIDTGFAAVSLYALSLIEDYVFGHESGILVIGGTVLVCIGLWLALRRPADVKERSFRGKTAVPNALEAAGWGLSNPAALLFSCTLMASFGLGDELVEAPDSLILVFVFLGEMTWWNFLTYALVHFKKFSHKTIRKLSHISGWGIAAFGITLIVKGFFL